ncbi:UDP-4-amino-4,6-dideoxy-N-acetyl-beta-L-altrosamine N-acetyltransferase [Rhizobium altiplani]|uniref:UDP-4-amino-4, 6-dideoxy-N-acetyl-beta-L-altrosamine N-acetyltransferase n=2 Tax=Rhizobium altiplani TaxID=1864509 RepID=A0A109K2I5_9HYPH|nr:UDP-4-amino-4,6-dideoxy-N-acetyl-beta-L-altrosamine N-acetyltransferase [Rhizobium altiplani]
MEEFDLDCVLQWRNSEHVRRYMYTRHQIQADEHRAWFSRKSIDPAWHLLIFEQDRVPQGYVSIHVAGPGGVAEWGFYAAPDAPKGAGKALGIDALDHCFSTLRLQRVWGQCLASNLASVRLHERMGFSREGELRNHHFNGQTYENVFWFGILAYEWPQARTRLLT